MDYTVEVKEENGDTTNVATVASESEAIDLARKTAQDSDGKVYISWFRASDGQQGYLNFDGHNPVGEAW